VRYVGGIIDGKTDDLTLGPGMDIMVAEVVVMTFPVRLRQHVYRVITDDEAQWIRADEPCMAEVVEPDDVQHAHHCRLRDGHDGAHHCQCREHWQ
jgi:hypothetical protein